MAIATKTMGKRATTKKADRNVAASSSSQEMQVNNGEYYTELMESEKKVLGHAVFKKVKDKGGLGQGFDLAQYQSALRAGHK